MKQLFPYLILISTLFLSQCTKDTLGVNDTGTNTGNGPGIIIKRLSQEDYYAKKYSGSKNKTSNGSINGGGVFNLSYQDLFFDAPAGNEGDVVRPIGEKNLLLVDISMVYQNGNKEGIQDFGPHTSVKFNTIELFTAQNQSGQASQRGFYKRNFAFTRSANGSVTGAPEYEGSTELYDPEMMNFTYTTPPLISVLNSDTVGSVMTFASIGSAILFDSGKVFPSTNDMVVKLNRRISKGSVLSFEKLRGSTSLYPYVPSVVTYELLSDTNEIRIPKKEVAYVIETLQRSTGVSKPIGKIYPFWLNVIESGLCDTLRLIHAQTGKNYDFSIYQYFEFGRKMYFK
ncbi:MAG: hypothetical protein WDA22_03645 [Bacteroidota bacterium]